MHVTVDPAQWWGAAAWLMLHAQHRWELVGEQRFAYGWALLHAGMHAIASLAVVDGVMTALLRSSDAVHVPAHEQQWR